MSSGKDWGHTEYMPRGIVSGMGLTRLPSSSLELGLAARRGLEKDCCGPAEKRSAGVEL